jgi:hypothetical protein
LSNLIKTVALSAQQSHFSFPAFIFSVTWILSSSLCCT